MADNRHVQLMIEQLCKQIFKDWEVRESYLSRGNKIIGEVKVRDNMPLNGTLFVHIDQASQDWRLYGTELMAQGNLDSPDMGVRKNIRVTTKG